MDAAVPPTRSNVVRYATGMLLTTAAILAFWPGFARTLFGTGQFLPHVFCYLRNPALVWTHAITDVLIGLSYVAISFTLTWLVHRARRDIPFSWIFLAFGLFIVACGATHFMEVVVLWKATYWLSAAVKIVTAVASVATAIVLPPLVPRAVAMVQEAKRSGERRVQLQQRLEELERERDARVEAEEANRAKDAFLAMISHELRTPMTTILGWSSMLNHGTLDAETQKTGVVAIEQSARVQAQIIDDLLDVSRIVTGKLALEPRRTELADVVRSAVEANSFAAETKGLTLSMTLPSGAAVMVADAARLHQAVSNVLSNAIKFTPAGGEVRVVLRCEEGEGIIEVSDTGKGIDSRFLPFIFDRFTQADTTSTRGYGGLGLGLAIVRHLIELHGGHVAAKSEGEGKGSTFTIRLPLSRAVHTPEYQPAPPEEEASIDLAGVTALVVEDEPLAREMMVVALSRYGAAAVGAGSVAEALAAMGARVFDVIVTDIAMPEEDGFELLKRVRERESGKTTHTPVIAVSALARADERNRIMMSGFHEFLQKPVDPARLAAAVAAHVRER